MVPLREVPPSQIMTMKKEDVRAVKKGDFAKSMSVVPPSVSKQSVAEYAAWNEQTMALV
jgi:hypothetical protein